MRDLMYVVLKSCSAWKVKYSPKCLRAESSTALESKWWMKSAWTEGGGSPIPGDLHLAECFRTEVGLSRGVLKWECSGVSPRGGSVGTRIAQHGQHEGNDARGTMGRRTHSCSRHLFLFLTPYKLPSSSSKSFTTENVLRHRFLKGL